MTTPPRRRISLINILIDLLIDLALMIAGFLVYYHFMVSPLIFTDPSVAITISPVLTNLVGGFNNAVYLMSGLPFFIGLIGLISLCARLLRGMSAAAAKI